MAKRTKKAMVEERPHVGRPLTFGEKCVSLTLWLPESMVRDLQERYGRGLSREVYQHLKDTHF